MTTPTQIEELKPCRLCAGGHTRYVPDKLATALIHHCAYTDKELPRTVIRIDAKDRAHCLEIWNKQNSQPNLAFDRDEVIDEIKNYVENKKLYSETDEGADMAFDILEIINAALKPSPLHKDKA